MRLALRPSLILLAACLVLAGCTVPANSPSATMKGPFAQAPAAPVAPSADRSALARITVTAAEHYVIRNQVAKKPGRAEGYLRIADSLAALRAVTTGAEIDEAAVRAFVARNASFLAPGDDELVVGLLMEARSAFLASTGESRVTLLDPRIDAWLDAIARGIRSGVAAGQAMIIKPTAPPEPRLTIARYPRDTVVDPAGHLALRVEIAPEFAYVVERSADLRTWHEVTRQPIGRGPATCITGLSGLPAQGFFRVRYWRTIDPDEFVNLGEPVKFRGASMVSTTTAARR